MFTGLEKELSEAWSLVNIMFLYGLCLEDLFVIIILMLFCIVGACYLYALVNFVNESCWLKN